MPHPPKLDLRRAALVSATVCACAVAALGGLALAKSFTLGIAHGARVTSTRGTTVREDIVVGSHGRAVYTLSGDSRRHPECTKANRCFAVWSPVTVAAKDFSKAPGINGKLAAWHRDGLEQLTAGGHPLYRYVSDSRKNEATGEGIRSFGGTWHVIRPSAAKTAPNPTGTTPTTPTSPTTTPTPCVYCY